MHIPQGTAERIVRMEKAYTELTAAVQKGLPTDEKQVSLLSDYMASGLWMQDYALDEQGALPPDLKRGVLSQDGLYNLLQEIKEKPMSDAYHQALNFWNTAFTLSDETRERYQKAHAETDSGHNLARSRRLAEMICEQLKHQSHVLDYGCGEGWAGLSLAKAGCAHVTGADLSQNAIARAHYLRALYGVEDRLQALHVDENWLSTLTDGLFDGIICSNVLDVVPEEVTRSILLQFSRVAAPGARVIISLNYYMEPRDNPERNIVIQNGNQVFLDGVLRLVTRTDEDWHALLSEYFSVEECIHYAWDGEETARRRMFVLHKEAH